MSESMHARPRFALLVAAALMLPNSAPAGAQTIYSPVDAPPVQVTACRVAVDLPSIEETKHTDAAVAGPLWITFKNAWPEPATEVTLRIKYGDTTSTLVERGLFSTGASISRTSDTIADVPWAGSKPETCAVASVRFANGTAWMPAHDTSAGSA
jgi:hypothetical protein